MKQLLRNKILLCVFLFILVSTVVLFAVYKFGIKENASVGKNGFGKIIDNAPSSSPTPTFSPTPTPTPMSFSEMNRLFGPCVKLPVLMYHRVQTKESAVANKQTSISVYTDIFESQMQYLKDKGYNVVSMNDLVNFFDNGVGILPKSVMITFDDGYADFATDANPVLQKFGFSATVFVSTGLVNNPGYLSWEQINSIGGRILFANHTWSHKNVGTDTKTMEYEILTADTQLSEHNVNSTKVFAYPYGFDTGASEKYLNSLNYKAAFTTVSGNTLCKKQRFALPRIRIGNTSLSSYGF